MTDPAMVAATYLKALVEGWQVTAQALGSVPEMVIQSIFPWCFTPELYDRTEYLRSLADFVRTHFTKEIEVTQSGILLTPIVRD